MDGGGEPHTRLAVKPATQASNDASHAIAWSGVDIAANQVKISPPLVSTAWPVMAQDRSEAR